MSERIPKTVGAVVLAAGKGTRLGCTDRPKVMCEIGGRPIVAYTVETLRAAGLAAGQLVLVVGFQQEKIREYFGESVSYALQAEQKGTAHAAYVGSRELGPEVKSLLVLGGDDSAFYKPETIEKFVTAHLESSATVTVLTAVADNPEQLGRVVRDDQGLLLAIKEKEELAEGEQGIKEINTGTYGIDREWFEKIFPEWPTVEGLGELGLNKIIELARKHDKKVWTVKMDNSQEWLGINTPEELAEADRRKLITSNI